MKIAVAGIGYVGLANAVLLAQHHSVYAVDINMARIGSLNQRRSPIADEDIEQFLKNERLDIQATNKTEEAYTDAEVIIIATPTDYDPEKNYFNTSSIEAVLDQVFKVNHTATIVVKSTVPVGYTRSLIQKYKYGKILFSPEFLREGQALHDNLYPSRIIVGYDSGCNGAKEAAEIFGGLLRDGAVKKDAPTLYMELTEAEAVKLFANTYLAMRVAFFNELDTYAEMRQLDSKQIIKGVCLDPRIGTHYNNPSFGYGGYCLPKDTKQLLANYDGVPENIMKAVVEANGTRKDFIAQRIVEKLQHMHIKRETAVVGVYRLTMKSQSDNFRQSSIQGIIQRLNDENINVLIFEPTYQNSMFFENEVTQDIQVFKGKSDIIIANRYNKELDDVKEIVYSRDLFFRD